MSPTPNARYPSICLLLAHGSFAGCRPHFDTVEDACPKKVKGASALTPFGEDLMRRIDCHRRVAGLYRSHTNEKLVASTEAHAEWMDTYGLSFTEAEGTDGFTGYSVWDRMEAQGYPIDPGISMGAWELISNVDAGAEELVDGGIIASGVLREVALQLSWKASGVGQGEDHHALVVVYGLPANEQIFSPLVYPADGQLDIPVSYYAWEPDGYYNPAWLPWGELLGFPITLTFNSSTFAGGGTDPYDISLLSATLTGPGGEVPIQSAAPGDGNLLTYFTAVVLPLEPLETNADYQLDAVISSVDGERDFSSTFHTSADDTPANASFLTGPGINAPPLERAVPVSIHWRDATASGPW